MSIVIHNAIHSWIETHYSNVVRIYIGTEINEWRPIVVTVIYAPRWAWVHACLPAAKSGQQLKAMWNAECQIAIVGVEGMGEQQWYYSSPSFFDDLVLDVKNKIERLRVRLVPHMVS